MNKNVECTRCGYRWFSQQYDEREILPHYCTRCFRKDIRPIPKEPNVIQRKVGDIKRNAEKVPDKAKSVKKSMILWKENNRYLIDMMAFVLALLIIFGVLYLFIFVWG